MINLKNTLFLITLATGTITLAWMPFTPKLLVKNVSNSSLYLQASDNALEQLKLKNSPNLAIHGCNEKPNSEPYSAVSLIKLDSNEIIAFDSVNICLKYDNTQLLSPQAYYVYRSHHELKLMFKNLGKNVKTIASRDILEEAYRQEKDIMIHVDIMLIKINPPIPYLEIVKTELIDRA